MAATFQGDSPLKTGAVEGAHDATATAANRREHVRVRPDDRNRLTATLASGSDIRLIDLSRGGAQFECDRRFLPNATVSLRLLTSDGEVLVSGRVVRSRIVRLASGGLGYLVGVAFAKPLQTDLDDPAAASSSEAEPVDPVSTAPAAIDAPDVLAPVGSPFGPSAALESPVAASPVEAASSTPTEPVADITAEEVLAFEATIELAPAMMTVTASVDTTSEQLNDMFNGNDW